jgi:hypothetical protein
MWGVRSPRRTFRQTRGSYGDQLYLDALRTPPLTGRRTSNKQGETLMRGGYPPATAFAALAILAFSILAPAQAQQVTNESSNVNVNIEVTPFAELEFLDTPLLYLEIPPPGSTVPSNGVDFRVIGNASATLTAEPDAFIEVPVEGFLGKAVLNGNAVGYKLELRFPRTGVPGSPIQIAALPGFEEGPTTPPLEVNLTLTGGERLGVLHMESDPAWNDMGTIPLPGIYVGAVTLTLVADEL